MALETAIPILNSSGLLPILPLRLTVAKFVAPLHNQLLLAEAVGNRHLELSVTPCLAYSCPRFQERIILTRQLISIVIEFDCILQILFCFRLLLKALRHLNQHLDFSCVVADSDAIAAIAAFTAESVMLAVIIILLLLGEEFYLFLLTFFASLCFI